MSSRLMVVDSYGRFLYYAHRLDAQRMVARNQAVHDEEGRIQLTGIGVSHPCRTRISNGLGVRAACGMSQVYTTSNHGKVDGHKRIFAEDVRVFYTAVIECSV